MFGTIVEPRVAILVDISGSMMDYMDELKQELASLMWDQLYPQKVRYEFRSRPLHFQMVLRISLISLKFNYHF